MTDETKTALLSKLRAPVASAEVMDALNWVDDFIARCNRDDRGSCESVNVLRRALASAAVAGEAQPTDAEIIDLAVEPLGIDCDRMPHGVVVFARNLLSRYAAPQASEAVRDSDPIIGHITIKGKGRSSVDLDASHADLPEGEYVIRAALSAQPGAQRTGGSDAE